MRIINLTPIGVGRYDSVSPFIVTDNKLELQVELPNFNGEFYLVYEINGKTDKHLLPRSGQTVLENLTAGEFKAEVKHYVQGELIKTYKVEPLLLKEVDGTLSALPEIEEMTRRISALDEYKQKQDECNKAFSEKLKAIENNVFALIRFAYKDFTENVYLNGGTVQDFIREFGFKLTEEQIKLIKGEKEDD